MRIYELTIDEYRATLKGKRVPHYYYNREGQIRANHRDAVANALQLGWNIPAHILDYFRVNYPAIYGMYRGY